MISNFFPLFFIAAMVSLPFNLIETMRYNAVATLSPSIHFLRNLKSLPAETASNDPVKTEAEEIKRLQLENQLLSNEIVRLKELVEQENVLFSQNFSEYLVSERTLTNRENRLKSLFQLQLAAVPARVIYRAANSWNSSLWVNVGMMDNDAFDQGVVTKNSPVVLGDAVVGVVDYVGLRQSRIRLITDADLCPSVRVLRGEELLAKGELHGKSLPLWRSRSKTLAGVGFNYDFADVEGPVRDLRTGEALNTPFDTKPILLVNDLLVTTGMDGVFPPGLKVAKVTKIQPLKEGDYYYDLEAEPLIPNLEDLSLVFILPPQGFEKVNVSSIYY